MRWIIRDAYFCKAKDLPHFSPGIQDVLLNFINGYFNDRVFRFHLKDISDVYFLIGFRESEHLCKEGELKFKDILNPSQYSIYSKYGKVILGVMHVRKSEIKEDIHYIEWIDSFVNGHGIARFMRDKYSRYHDDCSLVPREFVESSIEYWIREGFGVHAEFDFWESLEEDYGISQISHEIKWGLLYDKLSEMKQQYQSDCDME